jgi:hypothetical protein
MDLYEQALDDAKNAVRIVYDAVAAGGGTEGVAEKLGEESLETGREHAPPRFCRPFPLPEIIDGIYARMAAGAAG